MSFDTFRAPGITPFANRRRAAAVLDKGQLIRALFLCGLVLLLLAAIAH